MAPDEGARGELREGRGPSPRRNGKGCGLAGSPRGMSDLSTLERETLAAIEGAPDEGALETARVAALGKKGSISALLATLVKLAPDERKAQGAAINALKDQVTEALTARRAVLKRAALEAQLKRESLDVTLPVPLPG